MAKTKHMHRIRHISRILFFSLLVACSPPPPEAPTPPRTASSALPGIRVPEKTATQTSVTADFNAPYPASPRIGERTAVVGPYPGPPAQPTVRSPPTAAPAVTPTQAPTRRPEPTLLPLLSPDDFSPELVSAMSLWRDIENPTGYSLVQVSDTPNGVISVEWSPDGKNLLLATASGDIGMGMHGNIPVIVDIETQRAWSTFTWGNFLCHRAIDWSPDGAQLTFVREGALRLVDTQTLYEDVISAPTPGMNLSRAKFSHDGERIAVLEHDPDDLNAASGLWIFDIANASFRRLAENFGSTQLTWSPDDSRIALLDESFTSDLFPGGAARLWAASVESGEFAFVDLSPLPGTEGCLRPPVWLPDSNKALATVVQSRGVWLIDADLGVERLDLFHENEGIGRGDFALASTNHDHVVYSAGDAGVFAINLDSGERVLLWRGERSGLAWAPTEQPSLLSTHPDGSLRIIDASDATERIIAQEAVIGTWSADGKKIAFWKIEQTGLAIWVLDLEDSTEFRLTAPLPEYPYQLDQAPYRYDLALRWSPDGKTIAFTSLRGEVPEAYVVWVYE